MPSDKAKSPRSFDVIGNKEKAVAIIETPDELKPKSIAEAVMKKHKNVHSVLLKSSPRFGTYRTRKLKLIAGSRNTEVTHVEHGLRFLLDPRKAYFSPREGTERLRICGMIKPNETVMVFFAGIGPFAIAISKKTKAKKAIGIEINPDAVKYFRHNVKLNKLDNVEVVEGDVKNEARKFHGTCDRVVMPLPETSIDYLTDALNCLKPGGTVHMYCFAGEGDIVGLQNKIREAATNLNKRVEFLGEKKVLPYGPRIWKYRIDFVVK